MNNQNSTYLPPDRRETGNQRQPKKQEKRKQWRAKFSEFLSLEQILTYIEEVAITKKFTERGPLYQHLEGVLIDEEGKELFLYLTKQREKVWLQPYIYLAPNTIQKWESKRKTFELCQKDYSNFKAYNFEDLKKRDLKEKQKEKKRKKSLVSDEQEFYLSIQNSLNTPQDLNIFEECQEGAEREDEEEDQREETACSENFEESSDCTEYHVIASKQQSKLRRKQMKKFFYKQEIASREINLQDECLEDLYKEIGRGQTINNLVQKYINEKNFTFLQTLNLYQIELQIWENMMKNGPNFNLINSPPFFVKMQLEKNKDLHDRYLESFYRDIGNGEKLEKLVKILVQEEDGKAQLVLNQNQLALMLWETAMTMKPNEKWPRFGYFESIPIEKKGNEEVQKQHINFFTTRLEKEQHSEI